MGKLEYQFGLCKGVQLVGTTSRPVNRFEKNSEMSTTDSIHGANPERASCRLAENDTTQRRGSSISSVRSANARVVGLCLLSEGGQEHDRAEHHPGHREEPSCGCTHFVIDGRLEEVTDIKRKRPGRSAASQELHTRKRQRRNMR